MSDSLSALRDVLRQATPSQARAAIAELDNATAEALLYDWPLWARAEQLAPPGTWYVWLILAGRGWGKTRTGAEWVRERVRRGYGRIALIGQTAADVRDVIVEGESGLLAVHPKHERPHYEPSKRRLTWPNGATATTFSGDEPDQLRGPQHDTVWADELAKWRYAQLAWDNMEMGLRLGDDPRALVSTTPRPIPLILSLRDDPQTVRPTANLSTRMNAANVSQRFIDRVLSKYTGTRLGRQELEAEILTDTPGALWALAGIEACRVASAPALVRVVVGVDPKSGGDAEHGGETGIIVDAKGANGHGYTLADYSTDGGPGTWAPRVLRAYREHHADAIVVEKNQGGAMVAHTIRNAPGGAHVPIIEVWASRGKATRAEPIAMLAEQGRWHHVGAHPELESQLTTWVPGEVSPDRLDAHVWAAAELFPNEQPKRGLVVAAGQERPAPSRQGFRP